MGELLRRTGEVTCQANYHKATYGDFLNVNSHHKAKFTSQGKRSLIITVDYVER